MTFWQKLNILKDKIIDHGSHHEIMSFQALKGRFFVIYKKDNKESQNMSYSTAKNYAEMFEGEVKHISQRNTK